MKLIKLNSLITYKFRVDIPKENRALLSEVTDWATEMNIDAIIAQRSSYFKNEKDAIWFILRWS